MKSKQKGQISLAVMVILTLALVYMSEGIYAVLSGYGRNGAEIAAESVQEAAEAASTEVTSEPAESKTTESEMPEVTANPGTYEATSGEVTVRVTISQNAEIMAVTLVDFEGEAAAQEAAAQMTKQIVENQTVSVNGVEGQEEISGKVLAAVAAVLAGDGAPVE